MTIQLSKFLQDKLICPRTKLKIIIENNSFINQKDDTIFYPIINGIPILINEGNSIFSIRDYIENKNTTIVIDERKSIIKNLIRKFTPTIGDNLNASKNYKLIESLLPINAKILVIGGSIIGEGMNLIYENKSFEIIGSDVSFGQYTKIISDAHDIPFQDETFDCVVVQAVLEHVLDIQRCVSELRRVLKNDGIIYSETPFMQQVHMKQYDFTRFTHLGHRRLFRNFEEIESGIVAGPGAALAWSFTYFLRCFGKSLIAIRILTKIGFFISFPLKYFDYLLISRPSAYDSASAFYFIGKKVNSILPDKDLIKQFRGEK